MIEPYIVIIIAAAFGLIVGSFLNVVILRFRTERDMGGRSACMKCSTQLKWYELVPVFSFFVLRGKCRSCKKPISWQYPIVEILTAVAFALIAATGVSFMVMLFYMLVYSLLIVIAVYDFYHKTIPDSLSIAFLALGAFGMFFGMVAPIGTWNAEIALMLIGGPTLSFVFLILWMLSGGKWIGFGDIKLIFGIGWFVGLSAGFSAIVWAFWTGAAAGLILLGLGKIARSHGKLPRFQKFIAKSEIPFGPFLVLGTFLAHIMNLNVIALFGG